MRVLHFIASLAVLSLASLSLSGCGRSSDGPAQPATTMGEIEQFLSENPDQNTDDLDDEMEEEEEL